MTDVTKDFNNPNNLKLVEKRGPPYLLYILVTFAAIYFGSALFDAMPFGEKPFRDFIRAGEKTPFAQCRNWEIENGCLKLWNCTSGREFICGVEVRK